METPTRILITGYSGFVGAYLLEACRAAFPAAALHGLSERAAAPGAPGDLHAHVAPLQDAAQVRAVVAAVRPDLIFHLAAQSSVAASWEDPAATLAINAGGTVHLLEGVRAAGLAPRIVLVGSGEQYGLVPPEANPITEDTPFRPVNPYAVSKVAQDLYGYQYWMAYGLPIMRARPFNHFGPRQQPTFVIASLARQIAAIEAGRAEPELLVGNLKPERDFLPVEDTVAAYVALARDGHPGAAYNVACGQARSIASILEGLLRLARVPIAVREDPARFRPADAPLLVADASRLRADTGWAPALDFDVALARTLDYWRKAITVR
ncbi:MAG TPA: GDP-mannose 4,6-dehydratase [Ktedonobacterales bacterium]|nr:GDP-mannose 4,6-dehydratase [Ktedonobacterales bacterium]